MPTDGEHFSQEYSLATLERWVNEDGISDSDRSARKTLAQELQLDLTVNGDLDLSGCAGLTSLPPGLTVNGDLYLSGCTGLTALSSDLSVQGALNLRGCTGLISLPSGLTVNHDLDLRYCTSLTALPSDLTVKRDLNLGACISLTSLPSDLMIHRDLYLGGCTGLTALPLDLRVNRDLYLSGCTGLTTLPSDLSVHRDLYLTGCTGLTALPSDLTVARDLNLTLCNGLTSLPLNLTVHGNLVLALCTGLTSLPSDLTLGGNLNLSGCTGLTSLPQFLFSWGPSPNGLPRRIELYSTGLSRQIRERLRDQPNANLQFYYNEIHNERRLCHFDTLQEALESFTELEKVHELVTWPAGQQAVLCQYLGRLVSTADFRNVTVRPSLIKRLNAALRLAHADPDFRAYALAVLNDAMETCGDRVIGGLNTVELELALREARHQQGPEQSHALMRLGLSLMKLNIVHAHAAQSCKHMLFVDEVEVYLAYEVKLGQRLGLPGKTLCMLYSSGVGAGEFEAAAQDAERQSADPIAVQAFLATWTPWQQHLRKRQADGLSFDNMTVQTDLPATLPHEPRICAITQETEGALVQPIYLGTKNNARVYEYADLMNWWVEHGKEPAPFGAFTPDQLWRTSH